MSTSASNETGTKAQSFSSATAPVRYQIKLTDSIIPLMLVVGAGVLLMDALVRRGMGIGTLYLIVVLLSLLTRSTRVVIISAAATTSLIIAGWFISREGISHIYTIPHRAIAIILAWVIASIGCRRIWYERSVTWLRDSHAWLSREVEVRSRDTLSRALSLIDSAPGMPSDFEILTRSRLKAALAVNDLLARTNWAHVSFQEIFDSVIPRDLTSRFAISGRCSLISPTQAQNLALVLHEFAYHSVVKKTPDNPDPHVWIQIRQLPPPDSREIPEVEINWRQSYPANTNLLNASIPSSSLRLVQDLICRDMQGRFLHSAAQGCIEYQILVPLSDRPVAPLPIDPKIKA